MEEKSLTMLKHYEALKDFIDKGFVFKKCKGVKPEGIKYKCLVVLKKPNENFQCNENRKRVIDKNFAKFRCNGLITVAIYNMYTKQFVNYLYHRIRLVSGSYEIAYEVKNISIPDDYDQNLDVICTSGIHYFLSLEAALNYKYGILERYVTGDDGLYRITYSDEGEHFKKRITNKGYFTFQA